MAATATAAPRYAPEDPTLPKPWKGLVDGKTGYLYFWNPETNVTQYERPSGSKGSARPQKSSSVAISSAVQVEQSSQKRHEDRFVDDDDRYGRNSNGGSKPSFETRGQENTKSGPDYSHNASNGTVLTGQGGTAVRAHGSSGESGLSSDAYRRRHEITVTGDSVPPPFTSFEDTGFPSELLREVRYLLRGGAKCRTLSHLLVGGLHICRSTLIRWTNFQQGLSESSMVVVGTFDGDDSVSHLVRLKKRLLL